MELADILSKVHTALPFLPNAQTLTDRCVIVLVAFVMHMVFITRDRMMALPEHIKPARWLEWFVRNYEKKLNRDKRPWMDRFIRGSIVTLPLMLAAWYVGAHLSGMRYWVHYGWLIESALIACCMLWRSSLDMCWRLVNYNHDMSLYECRKELARISPFEVDNLDVHGVFRHAMERLALSFADSLCGVVVWYLLGGLPCMMLYISLALMHRWLGQPHLHYQAFGLLVSGIFAVMHIPVTWIAGLLLALASIFAPATKPADALAAWGNGLLKGSSWLPAQVMAGGANTQLGGKRRMDGRVIEIGWYGFGNPKPVDNDTRTAIRIVHVASLLLVGLVALVYLGMDMGTSWSE